MATTIDETTQKPQKPAPEGNSTFIVNAYNDIKAVDFACFLVGGGIIEKFLNVAPSNNSFASELLGLQILVSKIVVDGTSANTK